MSPRIRVGKDMAIAVLWISFAFVFYVYVGYPLLLAIWRRFAHHPVRKANWEPPVSIVIAARNERDTIERKLRNCLDLDYPKERLEIVVSLDGPTDGTEKVVESWRLLGIKLLHSRVHQGKAAALKRGVAAARNAIIVFADARQRIDSRAIRELVANLHDPSVGAVSAELILLKDRAGQDQTDSKEAIGLYWRYEKWIRSTESQLHSTVGATGALYAIRRELFRPIPDDTILDDVLIPMIIALNGKRVLFEPRARAYDNVACCPQAEFRRKVRTLAGNYQLLAEMPIVLSIRRNPIFFQFVSHKVGRLLVPYFLATLLLSNCFLLHGFYLFTFVLQIFWYALAVAGRIAVGTQRAQHMHKPLVFGRS